MLSAFLLKLMGTIFIIAIVMTFSQPIATDWSTRNHKYTEITIKLWWSFVIIGTLAAITKLWESC